MKVWKLKIEENWGAGSINRRVILESIQYELFKLKIILFWRTLTKPMERLLTSLV